jgi:hypothetical protein
MLEERLWLEGLNVYQDDVRRERGHLLKEGRLHRPYGKSIMGKGDGMKLTIRPLTPDL